MTYSKLLAIVVTTIMFNGININKVPTANSDLMTLKAIIEGFNGTNKVNVIELLAKFKQASGLYNVGNSDLVTYFSNLGVEFYTEV